MVAIVTLEVEPAHLVRRWWTEKKGTRLVLDEASIPLVAHSARTIGKYERDGVVGAIVQVTYWTETPT